MPALCWCEHLSLPPVHPPLYRPRNPSLRRRAGSTYARARLPAFSYQARLPRSRLRAVQSILPRPLDNQYVLLLDQGRNDEGLSSTFSWFELLTLLLPVLSLCRDARVTPRTPPSQERRTPPPLYFSPGKANRRPSPAATCLCPSLSVPVRLCLLSSYRLPYRLVRFPEQSPQFPQTQPERLPPLQPFHLHPFIPLLL